MANLTRKFSWRKWAPDIGENRELEGGPVLFLDIATGLTPKQLAEVSERIAATRGVKYATAIVTESMGAEEMAAAFESARLAYLSEVRAIIEAALSPYVRVADGPHTVDGETLATLGDYLGLVQQRADMGLEATADLMAALDPLPGAVPGGVQTQIDKWVPFTNQWFPVYTEITSRIQATHPMYPDTDTYYRILFDDAEYLSLLQAYEAVGPDVQFAAKYFVADLCTNLFTTQNSTP